MKKLSKTDLEKFKHLIVHYDSCEDKLIARYTKCLANELNIPPINVMLKHKLIKQHLYDYLLTVRLHAAVDIQFYMPSTMIYRLEERDLCAKHTQKREVCRDCYCLRHENLAFDKLSTDLNDLLSNLKAMELFYPYIKYNSRLLSLFELSRSTNLQELSRLSNIAPVETKGSYSCLFFNFGSRANEDAKVHPRKKSTYINM